MGSPETHSHGRSKSEPDRPAPPAAPDPSADAGIRPSIHSLPPDDGAIPDEIDIFTLTPVAALKMLCRNVDALVKITGDVPPTPPITHADAQMNHTRTLVGRMEEEHEHTETSEEEHTRDQIDGVPFVRTPMGSPEAHASEPFHVVGAGAQPVYIQHGAIARRFYSKKPPPITLEEYLLRLHRYCPMSTAVYLATSLYINRLAVADRVLPVTPRNAHRLLLAGLRVAMKALEDLSYPHSRFAKVGGVSEAELGRLEISFCFLTNFELKMDAEMLLKEAIGLKERSPVMDTPKTFQPRLPPTRDRRKTAPGKMQQVLPTRNSFVETPS